MGIRATLYRFIVEFSDIDQGIYETLDLRVAQHPSEDEERLVVRVLARAMAHEEGLEFGRGLSIPEDAGLVCRTMTGEIGTWIDVGMPSAERLHRASKAAKRVLVFTHKPDLALWKEWRTRKIHRADSIQVVRFPASLISDLTETLERKVTWHVMIHEGQLSVTVGDRVFEEAVEQCSLVHFLLNAAEPSE